MDNIIIIVICEFKTFGNRWLEVNLHVPVQFFQQCRVSLQSGEGFTKTGGQSQDPWTGCPLWLHVLPQFLTVTHMKPISMLWKNRSGSQYLHISCVFRSNCIFYFFFLPVLCEYTDCRWMIGTVGHVHWLHLGHQTQKKPSDPLLVLWKSAHTQTVV